MKNKSQTLTSDFALIAFLTLILIGTFFTGSDADHLIINLILMYGCFIIVAITYFTNLTTGLILDILGIFATFSFMLYKSLTQGYSIPLNTYFWCFMYPATTVAIAAFARKHLQLQSESSELGRQVNELVILDGATGLKNEKALINDAEIYMNLAKRYKHGLSLCMIAFRHPAELRRLLSQEKLDELILHVSQTLQNLLRTEDLIYLIDREKMTWGILLLTNDTKSMPIVLNRLKQSLVNLSTDTAFSFKQISIDVRVGAYIYDDTVTNPLDFLDKATKELSYDVN